MTASALPRVAVIGAGVMGAYHARVVAQSERAQLVRVVEPRKAVGEPLARRFGCDWVPDVDSFSDVDAIIVASPTPLHTGQVRAAIASGVAVLVEKPVSDRLDDVTSLVESAAQSQVPLMCGFVERFNPAVLTAMALISDPVHVTAVRHSPYANRIRIGVGWDLLIHDVDACLRIVKDDPVHVRAGLGHFHPESAGGGEDVAEAVLSFRSGAVATASASRIGQRKIRSISIAELNRTVEVDLLRRDVTIYRHVSADIPTQGGIGYRQQTIIEIAELVSATEPLAAQFDHFLGLLGGRIDLKEELDSILPAHRVIDEVYASLPSSR